MNIVALTHTAVCFYFYQTDDTHTAVSAIAVFCSATNTPRFLRDLLFILMLQDIKYDTCQKMSLFYS